jgi:preprotein translocase subunit YajC
VDYLLLIVIVVAFGGMMWWQSRKAKQQQAQVKSFRDSLEPGVEVVTIGGIIGKVVSVDNKFEEIVIDSEGSKLRFTFRAVNKLYTRPAFVDDDEVDENGNPLPQEDAQDSSDSDAQVAIEDRGAEVPEEPADEAQQEEVAPTQDQPSEDPEAREHEDKSSTKAE